MALISETRLDTGATAPAVPTPRGPTTSAPAGLGRPTADRPASAVDPVDRLAHRALAALHRQPGRVLVTGRTTRPGLVAERLAELDPVAAPRALCADIHRLARQVLADRGIDLDADPTLVDSAWQGAWDRVGRHSVLHELGPAERWRAEIGGAIKGRGVTRVSEFHPRPEALAGTIWDLYVAYCEELTVRFAHDVDDLVSIALDELTRRPSQVRFGSVVIDPTVPLSPTMLRLLRAVACG